MSILTRYWKEILEEIERTVYQVPVCKEIVRRSGLRTLSETSWDVTLPPELDNPAPITPLEAIATFKNRRIARRVQNDLGAPVIVPIGDIYWKGSDGSSAGPAQNTVNRFHFTHYSEHQRPHVGARTSTPPVNPLYPAPGEPRFLEPPFGGPATAGTPWVGGSTLYDPFPYPEAPLYFWADLSQATRFQFIIRGRNSGPGPDPLTMAADGWTGPTGPMVLKTWASLDGGETWQAPYYDSGSDGFDLNGNDDPNAPWRNVYARYYARRVDFYTLGTLDLEEPGGAASGMLRKEMYQDEVLFKLTLETESPNVWFSWVDIIGVYNGVPGIDVG